jgi:ankyrin repeat protein
MVLVLLMAVALSVSAPAEVPAAADPFRDALVESIHHFADDGKLAHLQAILDKYPKLLDAKRDQQLGKPSHGDGFTPLQTAARQGRSEVVAFLIKKGAALNAADGYGYTPLHLAAEGGHLDVVKQLVKAGAKVDAKTTAIPGGTFPGGSPNEPSQKYDPIPARTALQIAEDLKHAEVAAFLKAAK